MRREELAKCPETIQNNKSFQKAFPDWQDDKVDEDKINEVAQNNQNTNRETYEEGITASNAAAKPLEPINRERKKERVATNLTDKTHRGTNKGLY